MAWEWLFPFSLPCRITATFPVQHYPQDAGAGADCGELRGKRTPRAPMSAVVSAGLRRWSHSFYRDHSKLRLA